MPDNRPWYREPESFIAIAALIVSLSAVTVGIYEAWLQRAHDRAEVWPHVEIMTLITPKGASLYLENTGLGPAIINSVVVSVDGKPGHNWNDVLRTLEGSEPGPFNNSTVTDHALRAGDKAELIGLVQKDIPPGFWKWIARVSMKVCYRSAFEDHWMLSDDYLGGTSKWVAVKDCPPRAAGTDF
jgi:hypothetical protein